MRTCIAALRPWLDRGRATARRLAATAAAVVVAVAAGCTSTANLDPPGVDLVDLDFVEATVFESTLRVAVRVTNDNPEPLVLDGMVITLELAGRRFGKGSSADRVELPRLGSVVQRLTVHVNHIAVATKIREVVDSAAVSWSITGKVWVVTPDGATRRLPIERQGTIDLRGGNDVESVDDPEADPTDPPY